MSTTPPLLPDDTNDEVEDSLEDLQAKLVAQRATRKACLEKHKQTTFMAVEAVKGTTHFDTRKLKERLKESSQEPDE